MLSVLNLNGGTLQIDEGISLTVNTLNYSSGNILGPGNLITTPVITSALASVGTVGIPYNYFTTANYTPSTYAATGLPAGLSINSSTGVISGTPTEAGSFSVSISATNGGGTTTETLEITVVPTTTLHSRSCGATISAATSFIYADQVPHADAYEFEVTYNGDVYPIVTSNDHRFRLSEVSGLPLVFGSNYSIRVRVVIDGVVSDFGTSCDVTTPSIPVTTLGVQSCGATISATTSFIYAASVVGADDYEFEVTHNEITYPTVVSNDYRFRLSEVEGLPLLFGATYSIKVRIHSNGFEGAFGSSCNVMTPSIPTTTLGVQSCGATLSATTSFIYAASVVGASAYGFEVTYDGTAYAEVFSNDNRFRLSEVIGMLLVLGGEYTVRVRAYRQGIPGAYGAVCTVTTPSPASMPTTTLGTQSCGATLSATTSFIYAASVVGVSAYGFEVKHNGITYPEVISNDYRFRLSEVEGLPLLFGATYSIRVRIHSNNQVGEYGTSCDVITPSILTTTLGVQSCEATLSTSTSFIYAASVVGANAYEFEVTYDGVIYPTEVSNGNRFRLSEVAGLPLVLGGTYSIRVRVHSNNQFGLYGQTCLVFTPGIPTTTIENAVCGSNVLFTNLIYATAVTNAVGYRFNIYNQAGTTLVASYESVTNSFSFSQLTGYQFNTTYQIKVQVQMGSNFGAEGAPCTITVIKEEPTRVVSNNGVVKTNMVSELTAYPNPFTTTFSITPLEGETATLFYQVYDVTGKMIESRSVEANEIKNHTIGEYYPTGMYLVIVRQGATTQTFKMVKQ